MLWGLGSNSSLKQIFAAQKKSIRAIEQNYVNYFYNQSTGELPGHTKSIFSKQKILTVHNIVLQHMLSFMYRVYSNCVPQETQSYFTKTDSNTLMHVRKSRNVTNFFTVPKTRLKSYDKTVFIQGPRLFNIMCTNFNKNLLQCTKEIFEVV